MRNTVELERMDTMNNGEFLMNFVDALGLQPQQRAGLVELVNNYAAQLVSDENGGSFCPFQPDGCKKECPLRSVDIVTGEDLGCALAYVPHVEGTASAIDEKVTEVLELLRKKLK